MKLTTEELQKLDDQVREIGKYLGMEFDQEYADRQERDWNYWSRLKSGDKKISFASGSYKMEGRFIIRGEFPKDKRGQIYHKYNSKWPEISVAMDGTSEKIARAIQTRLLPEYESQLVAALENNLKNDAYREGRLKTLQSVAEYFGVPLPKDDDKAIYPEMGRGIYKIEACYDGVKFEVSTSTEKALQIFEILKEGENKNDTDNPETIR